LDATAEEIAQIDPKDRFGSQVCLPQEIEGIRQVRSLVRIYLSGEVASGRLRQRVAPMHREIFFREAARIKSNRIFSPRLTSLLARRNRTATKKLSCPLPDRGINRIPQFNCREIMSLSDEFIGKYCIVRTYSAGVFAGVLKALEDREAIVTTARRLWYWEGSSSLSELATKGTSKAEGCKFPCEVESVLLTETIEIIPCTEEARLNIASVPVWTSHGKL
jgi:hypothetical protein